MQIKILEQVDYLPTWQAMQNFTANRDENTEDEIWLCEHPDVFTQGRHGKPEHILTAGNIPVIQTDRGGQVTYHGPGQLIVYLLIDLKRRKIGIKDFVCAVEKTIQTTLADYGITASLQDGAPGVYVNNAKIASVGLRVKHGKTYHGISLNIDMDLTPFQQINPCGYSKLAITDMMNETDCSFDPLEIGHAFVAHLRNRLP